MTPEQKIANVAAAVAEMLREYAVMIECGEMPALDGPAALRAVALLVDGQAKARADAAHP